MESLGFSIASPAFAQFATRLSELAVFFFFGGALWQFRRAEAWPRRIRLAAAVYAAGVSAAFAVGTGAVCLIGWATGAQGAGISSACSRIASVGLSNTVLGAVFLAAALAIRRGRVRRLTPRLLPLAERWRAARRPRGRFHALPRVGRGALFEGAGWLAAMLAYSFVWFRLALVFTEAKIAPEILEALEPAQDASRALVWASTLLLIAMAPVFEEVVYRGFVQDWALALWLRLGAGRSRRLGAFVAIAGASGFWALGHSGQIEPEWIKWVQIFGIGIALGVARLRLGLEACVLLHLLFNLLGGFCLPERFAVSNFAL